MGKNMIYKRGQIWFWTDPLFGGKSEKIQIAPGELTYRYSRYVLIIQNEDCITDEGILCIPLSSEHNRNSDIQIPLSYLWHETASWAKPNRIFPVHAKMLQRYICEVPKETMDEVDAAIIKFVCPFVTRKMSKNSIKDILGIDMDIRNNYDTNTGKTIVGSIASFIDCCIEYTFDLADSIRISDLKKAFDIFCFNNKIDPIDDTYHFIESFIFQIDDDIYNYIGWKGINKDICNIMEFRGMRLRERMVPTVVVNSSENRMSIQEEINKITEELKELRQLAMTTSIPIVTAAQKPCRRNNWNDERHIKEFINFCDNNSVDAAASEYGLSKQTVSRYYRKYSGKKIGNSSDISNETPDSLESFMTIKSIYPDKSNDEPVSPPPPILHPEDIPKSISNFSNIVMDYLKNDKIYEAVKPNFMGDVEFYAKVQSYTYFSLLELLGIIQDGREYLIPDITEDNPYLETWQFFDTIYHDPRVSMSQEGDKLMTLYRKYHDCMGGISNDWLEKLHARFQGKMALNETQTHIIIKEIRDVFIERN